MNLITGTAQNDSLEGTDGRDQISGLAGDDTLYGWGGADRLLGGGGNDALYGGEGMTGNSPNFLSGGNGNDLLAGGRGNDTLLGGAGDDTIWASYVTPYVGIDVMDGGEGSDKFIIMGAAATVLGGEGSDRFNVLWGENLIDGTDQDQWMDSVDYSGVSRRVVVNLAKGTALTLHNGLEAGHDTLIDIEMVTGSDGNDLLIGGNPLNDGMEAFQGGSGADTIDGGSGRDMLLADAALWGQGVTVNLHLHTATDTSGYVDVVRNIEEVMGTANDDIIIGNGADNTFYAAMGDDQIDGRGGFDRINYAGSYPPGFDGILLNLRDGTVVGLGTTTLAHIEAATGTDMGDTLLGNGGKNYLGGWNGDDRINGRAGDDVLAGDAGDDRLAGGLGADIFAFNIGNGHDLVVDFKVGQDHLGIHGYGFASAAEVLDQAEQVGRNTVFSFADGAELTLRHVQLSTLTDADFLF